MNILTRAQQEDLDDQMSRTPAAPDSDGVPGEHMNLIALLNRLGFNPMSKSEAMKLAESLLNEEWENRR